MLPIVSTKNIENVMQVRCRFTKSPSSTIFNSPLLDIGHSFEKRIWPTIPGYPEDLVARHATASVAEGIAPPHQSNTNELIIGHTFPIKPVVPVRRSSLQALKRGRCVAWSEWISVMTLRSWQHKALFHHITYFLF